MLSEIQRTQEDKHCMIRLPCGNLNMQLREAESRIDVTEAAGSRKERGGLVIF